MMTKRYPSFTRRVSVLKCVAAIAGTTLFSPTMMAQAQFTRGIGQYPGKAADYRGPILKKDNTLRNVALHRAAYASASVDYNLTAQLATDGIIAHNEPARLTVTTPDGPLSLRDKEKTLDGNIHSHTTLTGARTFLQFDWAGMEVNIDTLRLMAEAVYRPDDATRGYTIRVMGSKDGRRWQQIGRLQGSDLPGRAARQLVSSDPNKREAAIRLPMRLVETTIPISRKGRYSHVRLELDMPGCAYWRIYELNDDWLPSAHFTSAFAVPQSKSGQPAWLYVDLGTDVAISHLRLHWLHKARKARIQFSDDARRWTDKATLGATKALDERVNCTGKARYVRLLMEQADPSGLFVLSEMEVWGRGGLVAEAQNHGPITDWQLRREGDEQWITATVPGTVLTSYANIGAIPDNRVADNMRQISESYFQSDFLYRARFNHQPAPKGRHTYLNFDGINWKAEVYLNHKLLGRIDGAFIRGRFDITALALKGENLLEVKVIKNAHFGAVKVKNQESTDLNGGALGADNPTFHASIGWDWITSTPGREVGIWNDVYLSTDGGVSLSDPLVTTELNLPDTLATMTPRVMVRNNDTVARRLLLKGRIGHLQFQKEITLSPLSQQEVAFSPADYPQLSLQRMRLWWPNGYGEPYRYDAGFTLTDPDNGQTVDQLDYKTGIRQMSYRDIDTETKLYVNGKRVTPLGGNWG
ncbi:glycosyl hydrolase 2 galactose-binding domain-containing protein, partial [Prevotella sp.]|uniref:glycosyl hydrolase 2 galactose-binding domain-containing protein n=1 Tax=Prevotella sp. TaxID=59823 RepID=UPI002F93547A